MCVKTVINEGNTCCILDTWVPESSKVTVHEYLAPTQLLRCAARNDKQITRPDPNISDALPPVLSLCYGLLNDTFYLHSCCRLSYQQPSMWTAMSWLFQTTCSSTTTLSTGEGLADSTLQKVRLLIWRMVGTFYILLFATLSSFSWIILFSCFTSSISVVLSVFWHPFQLHLCQSVLFCCFLPP